MRGAAVTVEGPYDAWHVIVEPLVDGLHVSGWGASVSVGSEGVVTNASGVLGIPEGVGTYPLLDTRGAIDRLNDQQSDLAGGPRPLGPADDLVVEDADAPATASGGPVTTTIGEGGCVTDVDGSTRCEASAGVAVCAEPGLDPSSSAVEECLRSSIDCADLPAPPPGPEGSSETTLYAPDCIEPLPVLEPQPEPEPLEVVLTHAEVVLVSSGATDGSGDLYLVGGYRLSNEDGFRVDVIAVDGASLAPTTTPPPDTTVPFREPRNPIELPQGEEPELGVGYYVDVNTHCGWIVFADRWWATDEPTPLPWSTPTEGGTFTLSTPDEGTFVGDYEGTKSAVFTARGPADELALCA